MIGKRDVSPCAVEVRRRKHYRACADAGMCLQATAVDSSEEGDQDDDDLCIVCWEKLREVIFDNCMHMVRSC